MNSLEIKGKPCFEQSSRKKSLKSDDSKLLQQWPTLEFELIQNHVYKVSKDHWDGCNATVQNDKYILALSRVLLKLWSSYFEE